MTVRSHVEKNALSSVKSTNKLISSCFTVLRIDKSSIVLCINTLIKIYYVAVLTKTRCFNVKVCSAHRYLFLEAATNSIEFLCFTVNTL